MGDKNNIVSRHNQYANDSSMLSFIVPITVHDEIRRLSELCSTTASALCRRFISEGIARVNRRKAREKRSDVLADDKVVGSGLDCREATCEHERDDGICMAQRPDKESGGCPLRASSGGTDTGTLAERTASEAEEERKEHSVEGRQLV